MEIKPWIIVITLAGIMAATYTDIKTKEIPLWIFPSVFFSALVSSLASGDNVAWNMVGMGIVFMVSIAGSIGGLGGGDVIMFSALSFIVGPGRIITFFGCMALEVIIYALCYRGFKKTKARLIPLAPFCIIPFVICCLT